MLAPFPQSLSIDDKFHPSARDWHRLNVVLRTLIGLPQPAEQIERHAAADERATTASAPSARREVPQQAIPRPDEDPPIVELVE